VYVIVDDYDLVAAAPTRCCRCLPFLSQARDIGLYPYVARRAGGATRALLDPFLSAMRELGYPAVVLSAPRDEAPMFGVRPAQLPPGRGTLVHRRLGTVPVQTRPPGDPPRGWLSPKMVAGFGHCPLSERPNVLWKISHVGR